MTPPELRALLADCITVWDVAEARVAIEGEGVVVTGRDLVLRVDPAAPGDRPLRWWITRPGQRRPCTGTLGLLRGLRNALGAGDAPPSRLRVSPTDGA